MYFKAIGQNQGGKKADNDGSVKCVSYVIISQIDFVRGRIFDSSQRNDMMV